MRESAGGFPGDESLYAVLQVSPRACPEVIQAAYRVLARAYHPDVSNDADAERRTRQLNAAYKILGDPGRRADYDANLAERARSGAWQRRSPPPGRSARTAPKEPGRSHERPMGPVLLAWLVTAAVATTVIIMLLLMLWSLYDGLDGPGGRSALSGWDSSAPVQAPFAPPPRALNGMQPH